MYIYIYKYMYICYIYIGTSLEKLTGDGFIND